MGTAEMMLMSDCYDRVEQMKKDSKKSKYKKKPTVTSFGMSEGKYSSPPSTEGKYSTPSTDSSRGGWSKPGGIFAKPSDKGSDKFTKKEKKTEGKYSSPPSKGGWSKPGGIFATPSDKGSDKFTKQEKKTEGKYSSPPSKGGWSKPGGIFATPSDKGSDKFTKQEKKTEGKYSGKGGWDRPGGINAKPITKGKIDWDMAKKEPQVDSGLEDTDDEDDEKKIPMGIRVCKEYLRKKGLETAEEIMEWGRKNVDPSTNKNIGSLPDDEFKQTLGCITKVYEYDQDTDTEQEDTDIDDLDF